MNKNSSDIKGLRPSLDIQDLLHSGQVLRAYARISEPVLVFWIKDRCDLISRVNTSQALAIAEMAASALQDALKIQGRADRLSSLKDIAVWVGSVNLGWL